MFRWLSPMGLLDVGFRVALAGIFGRYADKRESQAALEDPQEVDFSHQDELWIDYVGDVGDAFAPTYTIARLLAPEQLTLSTADGSEEHLTERGRLLIMGGDQVYPVPMEDRYENQFKGPYRAALPCAPGGNAPTLFAIPGNHDWYDGLTTFTRLFCSGRWVGGWRTQQNRSYFVVKLPHRWWVWGIDIAFDFYIDEPQLSYFRDVARTRMRPGDKVILCTAKPSWVHETLRGDERYTAGLKGKRNLEFFEREVVRPHGLRVPLVLAGDLHHYARYGSERGPEQRITSGGGGAFLYPTHHLPARIAWLEAADRRAERTPFRRAALFPDAATSGRLRWRIPLAPFLNPSFGMLTAVVQLLLLWLVYGPLRGPSIPVATAFRTTGLADLSWALVRSPASLLLVLVVLGSLTVFADANNRWLRLGMGLVHALGYLLVLVSAVTTWSAIAPWDGAPFVLGLIGWVAVWGYVGGSLVMGVYLFGSQMAGRHPNEAFSAQRLMEYKNFVRLKVERNGSLTIYPVGVARVPKKWRLMPDGPEDRPWFEPEDRGIEPNLIEPPVRIAVD